MKKLGSVFLLLSLVTVLFTKTAFSDTFACMETDRVGYNTSANMEITKFKLQRFVLSVNDELNLMSSKKIQFHESLVKCVFDKKYSEVLCHNGLTRTLNFNTDTLKFVYAGIPTSEDDPFLSYGDCERF